MRTIFSAGIPNPENFKTKLLAWAQQFREVVYMDSNNYAQSHTSFDALLAVDALTSIETDYTHGFDELNTYQQTTKDWLFGYLSYDLKNNTEALTSHNFDGLGFPDLFFFQPKKIFLLKGNTVEAYYLNMCDDEWEQDLVEIKNYELGISDLPTTNNQQPITIQQRIPKDSYIQKVEQMRSHIYRGDIYEANFCMEFYAKGAIINPLDTYQKLNAISEPPFAVYLKNNKQYLLSASPERYLKREGSRVITQPIKGTARRSSNPQEDEAIKQELQQNEKERAENIMIVDLVRNDLSHTAEKGSVKVEELCGVYTFKQVHHLISTVSSSVGKEFTPVDIIKSTFPMGSMTGAPKISAMKIIERLEETKRGLYSGAVGYFTPNDDFDFNVVIRSILYNEANKYVSFSVGSAITYESAPEKEYDECLLKANAMRTVLTGK